jgi:hypothetical protein
VTPVWVVDEDPAAAATRLAPDRAVVDSVPEDADWDLAPRRLVWPVTVHDRAQCPAVLDAVVRGVAVVVRVTEPMSGPTTARFVDELHRAAGPGQRQPRTDQLTEDHRRLLTALAGGATVAAAAEAAGLAPRTASRRLTEARRILGCATTAEAVGLVTRSPAG